MKYFISLKNPLTHFFNVRLDLNVSDQNQIQIELPLWRPGRYEAANYAKNIRGFSVKDAEGSAIEYIKENPGSWKINTENINQIEIDYDYWAFKMDAGNSWYDEEQLYINFINCLVYEDTSLNDQCIVHIDLPDHYQVACGLQKEGNNFIAENYYELVDSPLMSGTHLKQYNYQVGGRFFYIWMNGTHDLNMEKVVEDFRKFTQSQIDTMNEFPEREYHFLLYILPYPFYHGVEHHDSTVICLGPDHALQTDELYSQLLGVSSHELFHAWNIIKIRPTEMMPYKFNQPVSFSTGFVAEGFTTYYGDLFLVRGGTFDRNWYFSQLNNLFERHFSNFGRLNYSVVDSSLDLWIDGYAISTPERKSSIYIEGAMIALCLDLMIRKETENEKSLDDVMRLLWKKFGKTKTGYSYRDIQRICEEVYGKSLQSFFKSHVQGTADKEILLNNLLFHVGCVLTRKESDNVLENNFGIKLGSAIKANGNHLKIMQIVPGSSGEQHFSLGDEILSINGVPPEIENINQFDNGESYHFKVRRTLGREVDIHMKPTEARYLQKYIIEPVTSPTSEQKDAFHKWTGVNLT